jgi:hypothetical protein
VYRSSWPPEIFDVTSRIRGLRKNKKNNRKMPAFHAGEMRLVGRQAERSARRQVRLQ